MIPLNLGEIATILGGELVLPPGVSAGESIAGSVQTDSRLVEPGSTFFALPGETTDGHLFVPAAIAAGAGLIVAERSVDSAVPVVIVDDGVAALGRLAAEVVRKVRQAGELTVTGITGSNGKTTTKNLLAAILSAEAPTIAPRESFNNHVGAPISMLRIDHSTRHLIVEMGASGEGSIARLARLAEPDVAVVLSVGLAHAGKFGGIEVTERTKAELVTGLGDDDVAILNADDFRVARMAGQTRASVRTFGLGAHADVRAEDVHVGPHGTDFAIVAQGSRHEVRLRILGEHHVMNALAAVSAALALGVAPDRAIRAIESVQRAERWRMEVLDAGGGITVVNDAYNASPDSTAAALKTLVQIAAPEQRSVAVLGEMAELGPFAQEEHDRVGRLAVRLGIHRLIVVGEAARHIHLAASHEGSWDGESVWVPDSERAYDVLREELRAGDVVLVKSSKSAGLRFLGDRLAEVAS